ncbi:speckle-type POZ protein [Microplitis demolitor]|uniref:speckle-type POZ protein n=1 Tax=Microplitis demolitor TaxID=69319 RepID=UPI0004CD6B6C|nr:speckle-type POZ protein [Microplitis demolitor]
MEEVYSTSTKHAILYEWKINEVTSLIKSLTETADCPKLASPIFSTGAKINDSWYLELGINKNDELSMDDQYISVYLQPNNGSRQVRTKYSLFIYDNNKEKHFVHHDTRVFEYLDGWGFDLVQVDKLLVNKNQFIINDTLTVCVKLTVYDDDTSTSHKFPLKSSKRRIVDDFKELFESEAGSDVVLIVDDSKFRAHKSVLIARSSVFALMFLYETEEKTHYVTINDISPKIIEEMLKFIYTDQVTDIDGDAKELLKAADKYQLQTLKKLCEESLCKSITITNAVEIMILADENNARQLVDYVTNFIANNAGSFIKPGSLNSTSSMNCSTLSKLFKKITSKIISNARIQFPFSLRQGNVWFLFFLVLFHYIFTYTWSGVKMIYHSTKFYVKNKLMKKKDNVTNDDDNLLCGELTVINDHTSFSAKIPFKTSKRLNMDDFKELFNNNNEISSDVTLQVNGHEFKAHKVMLMVRNPMVSAMLMNKLKEDKVDIADIDTEILINLIEFILNDRVNFLNKENELLIEDVDKNQLQKLKSICDDSLCNSITLKYAMKIMALDDNSESREYATVFIVINITHAMEKLGFENNEFSRLSLSELDEKLAITNVADDEKDEEEKTVEEQESLNI